MENSIALAKTYLPLLDEVYKAASKTAILDSANSQVRFLGGNKVELFKTSLVGLGNYGRNTGFVDGDVTATWEELTLTQDRGRSFMVDSMDNEETLGLAFGSLASEFLRVMVIPEIDAYRFATYSAGAGTIVSADLAANTNVAALIEAAEAQMNDDEVPAEGRVCFISETALKLLKGNISRHLVNENGVNTEVLMYNNMRIIGVPTARFNTKITLKDGTSSGQTAGGFVPTATTGYKINFLIIHPSAVWQVVKHAVPRIFSPDVNQKADAWKFDYRVYHDAGVLDNKTKGVYLHKANTAIA